MMHGIPSKNPSASTASKTPIKFDKQSPPIAVAYRPPNTTSPTYDLDGNQTSDDQWNFTWDAEQYARIGGILDEGEAIARRVNNALSRIMNQNRLTSATRRAAALTAGAPYRAITYRYDSKSRKITRSVATASGGPVTTEKYLYDSWNIPIRIKP